MLKTTKQKAGDYLTYSSLHNHSEYSVLDGFGHPNEYLDKAQELGLKAFAITEHGNQYSWVYFDKIKKDYPDIKMIYGVELYECFNIKEKDKDNKYFHLVALAKNEQGRIALNNIITKSNFEGFYYKPRVDLNMLKPYAKDLIVLSACLASKLSKEKNYNKCIEYVKEYKDVFPYFFLEMQSHNTDEQKEYNQKILKLSKDTNTPFVITTDSHAATKEDLYYQGRLVQIAHDTDTLSEAYEGCYMQSETEVHQIMDLYIGKNNVDLGLQNTNIIADMIDNVLMPFQKPFLPTYPLPDGYKNNYEYLLFLVEKGWKNRDLKNLSDNDKQIRKKRLEYELNVIHSMGFDGYFLIVADFINYAKENNIIVGAGRGSVGGSLVSYLLGISELDPITYNLIFERFLNAERVGMPDIDCDFADRDKIISYLSEKYGENRVCQIINYSYITPIVAIKDTARVLNIPYYIADKISKKFTYKTFEECVKNNPDIYKEYPDYQELFEIAAKLSGRVRNASIHAGGVGIVDTDINNYMGMKVGSKGERVIQVDKKKVEEIGIVKFDILGVSTLSVVQDVIKSANLDPWELNINNPNFRNDKAMYDLLCSAKTCGVFQTESAGMRDLLLRLQPENLEDVSAVLALYRPDSMIMLEDYIYYKHHPDEIKYWHPDMEEILGNTYGAMIYQEQMMAIVRKFGGRTMGGSDIFRKAIGKKDVKLVKQESDKLYNEIINNGYSQALAKTISNHLAEFGGYMFNKSHSALYSILTLQTAYLKVHYPAYFFASLLNKSKDNYGKINKYILDAKDFNVEILPPDINKSNNGFTVVDNKILFGLEGVKDLGEKLVKVILEERKKGKFLNFNNFKERVNPTSRQIVALIKSGAIPCKDKKQFLLNYGKNLFVKKEYQSVKSLPVLKVLKEKYKIDTDMIKDKEQRLELYNNIKRNEFNANQIEKYKKHMMDFKNKFLQDEEFWQFEYLSVFLTDNPFTKTTDYITYTFEEIQNNCFGVFAGVISKIQKKKDKKGKQFAFITLYTVFGLVELTCWHTQLKQYEDLIVRGSKVAIKYKKNNENAIVDSMKTYEQWLKDRGVI